MNNKKKGTLLKDAMALFLVTLISALALSFVYELTKEPIAIQEEVKKVEALKRAYPNATAELDEELTNLALNYDMATLGSDYAGAVINEVNKAFDENGSLIGYIVQVTTSGYKDKITVAFGLSADGNIKGFDYLALNETPGLGMNASKPGFIAKFIDRGVDKFVVTTTGAKSNNEVDAITSSTITSKAVVKAVNAGLAFLNNNTDLGGAANE